jgi:lipoate-protein ligase A
MLFSSEDWIYGDRVKQRKNSLNTFEYKAPGGLIRASLLLDDTRGYIKSAFITGDFFAYPQRGILSLENALKNSLSKPEVIAEKINRFFASQDIKIPGADASDFIKAVLGAASAGKNT